MNIWGKVFYTISIIVIAILIGFLILLRNIPSDAVIAFLGVLFGGLISGFIQYSMSEANRKQNLRLAALDKRLQTAQEAYTLWLRLRRLPRYDEPDDGSLIEDNLRNCRDWWETHSLFLTAEARIAFRKAFLAAIRLYRKHISPRLPDMCRYYPTCSQYAYEAIEVHGAFKGSIIALLRLLRCNILFPGGYDPVPPKKR